MKFSIAREHRNYFQNRQAIEFDALLNLDQLNQLTAVAETVLSKRLDITVGKIKSQPADALFMAGHDLWRAHDYIKRIVTLTRLAEIASELTEQKRLRLGYDQFFPFPKPLFVSQSADPYTKLLHQQPRLKEISCLNGILCGLMLCLVDTKELVEQHIAPEIWSQTNDLMPPVNLFSKKAGNGVYFSPDARIDFKQLEQCPGQSYLMIVYTKSLSQYILTEADPHAHELKRLGLVFGDKLSDKLNPIVCR